jgi:hypothetical protein
MAKPWQMTSLGGADTAHSVGNITSSLSEYSCFEPIHQYFMAVAIFKQFS